MTIFKHCLQWQFSSKPIDFFIHLDETNVNIDDKKKKLHKQPIYIEFWHFLEKSPKSWVVIKDFDLQKMFRHVPRSSWSRFLAKDQENLISLNLGCRFQPFGRNRPFSTEKLKIFDAIFAEFVFPQKFVKVGNAVKNVNKSKKIWLLRRNLKISSPSLVYPAWKWSGSVKNNVIWF